jgi:HlyD family secretion protein
MALSKKRLLIVIGVAAALATAGLFIFKQWGERRRDTIRLSGNVEITDVNIAFKVPGKLIELNVGEGDPVRKGEIIARLDREQLLRQRDRAQAALTSAESQLKLLQSAIEYQKVAIEGQIEQRQAELRQAEANLRDLLAGARSQEIEQAGAAVDEARAERERAKREWDRAQSLHETGDISTTQYDQAKTRHGIASATLKTAEGRLALVVEGPRAESIEAARAQVTRAQAGLKLAEALRLDLKTKYQEIETRQAEIARAKAEVALIEAQLEDPVAVSSIDGVALVKAAEPGEVLAAGTTVVTIGDLRRPWLRGYIGEKDLGRVKLGAKVKVTTDSFPGKIYWGRVSFISPEAEFTPKQIQTTEERVKLVYRIKIDITAPDQELKLNMPVDAEILLNEMAADTDAPAENTRK